MIVLNVALIKSFFSANVSQTCSLHGSWMLFVAQVIMVLACSSHSSSSTCFGFCFQRAQT